MFPPFPIPDFVPNFTALKFAPNESWYEIEKSMSQPPINAIAMVSM